MFDVQCSPLARHLAVASVLSSLGCRPPDTRSSLPTARPVSCAVSRLRSRPALAVLATVVGLPVLIGMGAAWKAKADVADLYATSATQRTRARQLRGATEALTGQIQGLQTALDDLGGQAALDPALKSAMDRLPAIVKSRAMGGGGEGSASAAAMLPGLASPEDTFGLLRDMLQGLQSRLQLRPARTSDDATRWPLRRRRSGRRWLAHVGHRRPA